MVVVKNFFRLYNKFQKIYLISRNYDSKTVRSAMCRVDVSLLDSSHASAWGRMLFVAFYNAL